MNGLNRYDGHTFRNYYNNPEDSTSLNGTSVGCIMNSRSGDLWIGTDQGLNRYHSQNESFERYSFTEEDSAGSSAMLVMCIFEDQNDMLWLGTKRHGLAKFNPVNNSVIFFQHDASDTNSISDNEISQIVQDDKGKLWIATSSGLNTFDPVTQRFRRFWKGNSTGRHSVSLKWINTLYFDKTGRLWAGTASELNYFDISGDTFVRYDWYDLKERIFYSPTYSILEDSHGFLWVGRIGGGIIRLSPSRNDVQQYTNDPARQTSIVSDAALRSILEDREGNLWFGTDKGISLLKNRANKFRHIQHIPGDSRSLSSNVITTMCEGQDGNIWIGTDGGGLNVLDPTMGYFSRFKGDPANLSGLRSNQITDVLEDHLGQIWISTPGMGTYRYDHEKNSFFWFPIDVSFLGYGFVLFEDRSNAMWLGTAGGFNIHNPESDKFEFIPHASRDENSLTQTSTYALYEDSDGDFWVGTTAFGLKKYDRSKNNFITYDHDPSDSKSISDNLIYEIFEDSQKRLWLGTGRGLNCLDKKLEIFTRFGEEYGLPMGSVTAISEDLQGILWIGTEKGLVRFDSETLTSRTYNEDDGLTGNEVTDILRKSESGELYVGTSKGITVFDPSDLVDYDEPPRALLTSLQFYDPRKARSDEPFEVRGLIGRNDIKVSYRNNIMTFNFILPSFFNPTKNKYAYRLEGFNNQWIDLGTRREITFTNLDPTDYVLKIKGANGDGYWNEDDSSLKITITPPWYWSWWSKMIYAILLVSTLISIYRWRTARQRQKLEQATRLNTQLQQIDKLKDQFLANTSHELRTPLNGIIGIAESMIDGATGELPRKSIWNLNLITSSGKRLANLINDILDFSKLCNKQLVLKKTPVDIRSAVDVVLNLSKPLVLQKEVELINEVPEDLALAEADENRLQQILHNLVGNGVKFTETGEVKISAERQNGHIKIDVSDTGIGIREEDHEKIFHAFEQTDGSMAREYGGTGLGLSVTRQLVELHGGTIDVQSKVGEGSVFSFTLPTSKVGRQDFNPAVSDVKVGVVEDGSQQSNPDIVAKQKSSGGSSWSEGRSGQSALSNRQDSVRESERLAGVDSGRVNGKSSYRILIVDDEPVNLQVLENHLSLHNYSVTQASSGPKALEILQKNPDYDLIILDIIMPKMSGYEVCQKLREMYPSSQLPVVMLTAKNRVTDLMEGFTSGANDYLTKPFSKDELLTRIRTHLELAHINKAYGRFVPHDFLELLGKESIIDIHLGDQIEGEMTILFSDIRSYTTLSEQMTPEENFAFINAYLKQVGPLIKEHKGFISHYFGDGLMALFNGSPQDAIDAGVAMQQRVQHYNGVRLNDGKTPIEVGIGIHTGDLMVGIIGDEDRNDTGVLSDAVNTASRLEGLTSWFGVKIIVSEKCLNGQTGPSRFLGKVKVKGKERVVSVHEWYGGDVDEQRGFKEKTKADFAMGLKAYYEGEFVEAAGIFKNILKKNRKDKPTKFYLNRSAKLITEEVPEDWSGVIVMEGK